MIHMSAEEYQKMQGGSKKKRKGSKYHSRFVYIYEDGFVAESKDLSRKSMPGTRNWNFWSGEGLSLT